MTDPSAAGGAPQAVVLPEERWREARDLFAAAMHGAPVSDERWTVLRGLCEPGRMLGIVDDGAAPSPLEGAAVAAQERELVATVASFGSRLVVPGGATVPMAAVTAAAVRAGYTRRGLFTALIRAQLRDLRARGDVLAGLRASEAGIYPRYGYGPATRVQDLRIDGFRAVPATHAPGAAAVRLLSPRERGEETLRMLLPRVHARCARTGTMHRPQAWWDCWGPLADGGPPPAVAVHHGPDGIDGYAIWTVRYEGEEIAAARRILTLATLTGASSAAVTALWRFVLDLDLVEEIRARARPLDEPVPLLLADPRACTVTGVWDELWLRLVDLPAALRARSWSLLGGRAGVVLGVRDPVLPENSGQYRITPDGAERTDVDPELCCEVSTLAMAYLGDTSFATLAAAGLVEERRPGALRRADALFATDVAPWCGTFF